MYHECRWSVERLLLGVAKPLGFCPKVAWNISSPTTRLCLWMFKFESCRPQWRKISLLLNNCHGGKKKSANMFSVSINRVPGMKWTQWVMTRFFFFYNSLAGRVQSRHVNCFEFWTYSSCVDLSFRCDTWVRTCGVLDVVSLAEVTADTAEHETNPFSHFIQSRQSDQPYALFS